MLFESLESALASEARKHYPAARGIGVEIDPGTGRITTLTDGVRVEPPEIGRLAARAAKQVIIERIRESE